MEATEQSQFPVPGQGMMGGGETPLAAEPVAAAAAVVHNMRLAFNSDGTSMYKPDGSAPPVMQQQGGGFGVVGNSGPVKKKRGRPRKYGPDGAVALALNPISTAPGVYLSATTPTAIFSGKKHRGRPRGSGKKQQLSALGSLGIGFMPHVITVKAGEDVTSSIMSFSQQGPRAVCILSANGSVSNVTLRQSATSGGTVTYEGRFEILSLSGSFLLSESGGTRSRTGGLSVSLAGPDGRVLGGGVAGLLLASSPTQVVLGSFINADYKKPEPKGTDFSGPTKLPSAVAAVAGSPPSRGTMSESSGGGPGSPLNQSTGAYNHSQPGVQNMPWK